MKYYLNTNLNNEELWAKRKLMYCCHKIKLTYLHIDDDRSINKATFNCIFYF